MKNLINVTLLLVCLSGCNTSRQTIRDNAVDLNQGIVSIQAANEEISRNVSVISDNVVILKEEGLGSLKDAQVLLAGFQVDVEEFRLRNPNMATEKLSEATELIEEANQIFRQTIPVIEASTVQIQEKSEVISKELKLAEPLTSEIISRTDMVENTERSIFGWPLGGLMGWATSIAAFILLAPLLPALIPLILNSFTALFVSLPAFIKPRNKDYAALLQEAHSNPTRENIEKIITRFRSTTSGQAAWISNKRKLNKPQAKKRREFPPKGT